MSPRLQHPRQVCLGAARLQPLKRDICRVAHNLVPRVCHVQQLRGARRPGVRGGKAGRLLCKRIGSLNVFSTRQLPPGLPPPQAKPPLHRPQSVLQSKAAHLRQWADIRLQVEAAHHRPQQRLPLRQRGARVLAQLPLLLGFRGVGGVTVMGWAWGTWPHAGCGLAADHLLLQCTTWQCPIPAPSPPAHLRR